MAKIEEPSLPPIEFVAFGETPEQKQANLEIVLPSPGFPTTAHLMAEVATKRSKVTVLDYTQAAVNIRFQVDGIWHSMPPMDRETGDYMAATLKQLAGMNYQDRRSRQEGKFEIQFKKHKTKYKVISQGVPTGERIAIFADIDPLDIYDFESCGMRPKLAPEVKQILNENERSLTLVTGLPGEGYTTAWRTVLAGADRLMRDFFVIEEANHVEEEVINISSITYDQQKGETPLTPLPQLLLKEPNVLAFPDLNSGQLLNDILDITEKYQLPIMTRIPGKNAIDGLLRFLLLKPDLNRVIDMLKSVIAMRTIRKLCRTCRIPIVPNPSTLQQLGIPQGRVKYLYQPFIYQPGMMDADNNEIEMCPSCQGLGFKNQTGIFEVLVINDAIRDALRTNPRLDHVTAVARSQRHVTMREEGILLIAKGVTSIDELQRVLNK